MHTQRTSVDEVTVKTEPLKIDDGLLNDNLRNLQYGRSIESFKSFMSKGNDHGQIVT